MKSGRVPAAVVLLLQVVHPFDHAGRAQDVIGHALSPLAPRLAVDQDVVEPPGGAEKQVLLLGGVVQVLGEARMLGRPLLLQFGEQAPQLGQLPVHLGGHPVPLVVDDIPLVLELCLTGFKVSTEGAACHRDDLL